jgi:hypothetical protein
MQQSIKLNNMQQSIKVNIMQYKPSYIINTYSKFDIQNILLCKYNMIDVAIHLKINNPDGKILLHNFANIQEKKDMNQTIFNDDNIQEKYIHNNTDLNITEFYPIQNSYDKSINSIITKNCKILKSSDNKLLLKDIYLDIISLNALNMPIEKKLDLYNTSEFARYDYQNVLDKEIMLEKIKFLIKYAVGEDYDYFITGSWDIDINLNPYWGLINLWNIVLQNLGINKLKIIFCIPTDYVYNYFNHYLLNQAINNIEKNNLIEEKKSIKILSDEELIIKQKIYGIVWGMTFGEILTNYYISESDKMEQTEDNVKPKLDIMNSLDWNMCVDQTIILMRVLSESNMDINIKKLAEYLVSWKSIGLTNNKSTCTDLTIKYILSQSSYIDAPIEVAKKCYLDKGAEDMTSFSIGKNAINGIFKDYMRRTILCCKMLQTDTGCQASCLLHSFIINNLWNGKYITTKEWSNIISICHKIFDTYQPNSIQHKIDFDNYLSLGRNYQYHINKGIKEYIKENLNLKLKIPNHTFLPMTLSIILMYDIQGHILFNGRYIRNIIDVTEIPILDDNLCNITIKYNEILPSNYYFNIMQDLASIIPNNICNAVIGSILGIACWDNVYNIESKTDLQEWYKYVNNLEWLNFEIDTFVNNYLDGRKNSLTKKQQFNKNIQNNIKSISV